MREDVKWEIGELCGGAFGQSGLLAGSRNAKTSAPVSAIDLPTSSLSPRLLSLDVHPKPVRKYSGAPSGVSAYFYDDHEQAGRSP